MTDICSHILKHREKPRTEERPLRRSLVLGPMPFKSDPDCTLAAGPWCFAGREDFFPDWEERFLLAPEPLADRRLQEKAIAEAEALAADMIPRLAERLFPDNPLPEAYWETLLSPFCINTARITVEIWYRVKALVQARGKDPLSVALLPDACTFSMGTDADVVLHGALNPVCLHWIFSVLLRCVCPGSWSVTELEPVQESWPAREPQGFKARLKESLRGLLLRLPCPKLKGMSLCQTLRYSLALLHASPGEDRSRSLRARFSSEAQGLRPDLPLDPILIFLTLLPQSLRSMEHPRVLRKVRRPRSRVASVLLYEDALYRRQLAVWRGRGNRLVCVQHGGNYGMMQHISAKEFVEYTQHVFVTWGWTEFRSALGEKAGAGNFVPLPSPQLVRERDAWRGGSDTILFVGTEMPGVGYQLDSHPSPLQNVQYREDKQWFLEALGKKRRLQTLYRPYFPVPGTLDDATWVLPRFPRVRLCSGPLLPQILTCRLLILDHHGTTLLEAMAANVPLICYWNPSFWPVNAAFQKILLRLGEAGVWHSCAESAAVQVDAVWPSPVDWWRSEPVQKARKAFLDAFALVPDHGADARWLDALRTF